MSAANGDVDRGFLADLHEDDLAVVLDHTQAREYLPGDFAVREGDRDRSLFIVSRGTFDVRIAGADGPRQVRVLEAGDLFGEVAFFDGRPRSADVVALEVAEALVLTPASFQRLRLSHPWLALNVVFDLGRVLSERFRASDAVAIGTADE